MTNQPFGQPPAFGAPVPAPAASAPPVEEPARSRRTLVIAVACGVAALGVLGGAGALVLGGQEADTGDLALPPPAVAPVEPSVAPTQATPLPTAVVKGRNVFVPLVETDPAGEASAAPEAGGGAAVPTESATSAPTSGTASGTGTGSTGGSTGGSYVPGSGGGTLIIAEPAPTVTVTETSTTVVQDDELVTALRRELADLQQKLEDQDDLNQEEVDELEAQIIELEEDLAVALGEPLPAATVSLVSVAEPVDDATLALVVNGEEVTLDLVETEDEAGEEHPASTTLYRTGDDIPIKFTYEGYDHASELVTFRIASEVSGSKIGTTLLYQR